MGRVLFFLTYQGSERRDLRDLQDSIITVWVAVLQFVTARIGMNFRRDDATDLLLFRA